VDGVVLGVELLGEIASWFPPSCARGVFPLVTATPFGLTATNGTKATPCDMRDTPCAGAVDGPA
jgi:hypothetical protein